MCLCACAHMRVCVCLSLSHPCVCVCHLCVCVCVCLSLSLSLSPSLKHPHCPPPVSGPAACSGNPPPAMKHYTLHRPRIPCTRPAARAFQHLRISYWRLRTLRGNSGHKTSGAIVAYTARRLTNTSTRGSCIARRSKISSTSSAVKSSSSSSHFCQAGSAQPILMHKGCVKPSPRFLRSEIHLCFMSTREN